jgi:glycosyltransferase involved in cell wall biosynthesis
MKIGHFSFSSFGGAGQVASSLQEYQLEKGLDSSFFSLNMKNLTSHPLKYPLLTSLAIGDRYLVGKKSNPSMFSFLRSQHSFDEIVSKISSLDVVHLHWIPGIIKISDLKTTSTNDTKFFWSIHDMWPFTGGCHYAGTCKNFLEKCSSCPQVNLGFKNIIEREFDNKLLNLRSLQDKITIVFPSNYIEKKARESKMLSEFNSVVIGNPIKITSQPIVSPKPTEDLRPISNKSLVLGLVAGDLSEKRKNVLELISWWKRHFNDFQSNVSILLIGNNGSFAKDIEGVTVISGIKESEDMNTIYSSMSLHISLSREETFGYTIIESGLMGIPSICYSNTAQSELVSDQVTGFVINKIEDLKPLLLKLLPIKEFIYKTGMNAKKNYELNFSQSVIGEKYLNLYSNSK